MYEFLTAQNIADLLRISRRRVYELFNVKVEHGGIPNISIGASRRVRKSDFEQWLERRIQNAQYNLAFNWIDTFHNCYHRTSQRTLQKGSVKMDELKHQMSEKLATYYHSEYVLKNQPWILEIPFQNWLQREMFRIYGKAVRSERVEV